MYSLVESESLEFVLAAHVVTKNKKNKAYYAEY